MLVAAVVVLTGIAGCGGGAVRSHAVKKRAVAGPVDCFASPVRCGYPDAAAGNVGVSVSSCSSLPAFNPSKLPKGTYYNGSNLLEITTPGTTIKDLDFPSNITLVVAAANAEIDHVCVMTDGGGHSGSTALTIVKHVGGTTVENSTLGGANTTTQAAEQAITNDTNAPDTSADNDLLLNCGECVHGTWTLDNSYVDVTARIPGEHYEDWYFSDGTISANHDVFINPQEQTAEIFGNTNGGNGGPADNHVTITNSLLAGGGYMLYPNSDNSGVGASTMDITGNRFARCAGSAIANRRTGGQSCAGGTDRSGIWPRGGYFGVSYPTGTFCKGNDQTWKDNVWDDTGAEVICQSSARRQ
jgi:hypothetical protein